jgi:hypothetical protein
MRAEAPAFAIPCVAPLLFATVAFVALLNTFASLSPKAWLTFAS